jgi:hypothetical protein
LHHRWGEQVGAVFSRDQSTAQIGRRDFFVNRFDQMDPFALCIRELERG